MEYLLILTSAIGVNGYMVNVKRNRINRFIYRINFVAQFLLVICAQRIMWVKSEPCLVIDVGGTSQIIKDIKFKMNVAFIGYEAGQQTCVRKGDCCSTIRYIHCLYTFCRKRPFYLRFRNGIGHSFAGKIEGAIDQPDQQAKAYHKS